MRSLLILLLISTVFFTVTAQEPASKYNTEHPMVLINHGDTIFAVNIPSYKSPDDVQIIYKIEIPDFAFLSLVRDTKLITIKPKPFDINRLINGEKISIMADVFDGDYRHGGNLVYSNREIVMSEQLYTRQLNDLKEPSNLQEYDMVTLENSERMYVHKIQKAPSFNHLILIDLKNVCLRKYKTSQIVPSPNEITYKFINCGTLTPLYYNADDLKQ